LAIGDSVVDRVRDNGARVEDDVADERTVEEGLDAEIEISLGAGDRRAEVA
jgi:hypothetical protein